MWQWFQLARRKIMPEVRRTASSGAAEATLTPQQQQQATLAGADSVTSITGDTVAGGIENGDDPVFEVGLFAQLHMACRSWGCLPLT